jgi:hypothetical protein
MASHNAQNSVVLPPPTGPRSTPAINGIPVENRLRIIQLFMATATSDDIKALRQALIKGFSNLVPIDNLLSTMRLGISYDSYEAIEGICQTSRRSYVRKLIIEAEVPLQEFSYEEWKAQNADIGARDWANESGTQSYLAYGAELKRRINALQADRNSQIKIRDCWNAYSEAWESQLKAIYEWEQYGPWLPWAWIFGRLHSLREVEFRAGASSWYILQAANDLTSSYVNYRTLTLPPELENATNQECDLDYFDDQPEAAKSPARWVSSILEGLYRSRASNIDSIQIRGLPTTLFHFLQMPADRGGLPRLGTLDVRLVVPFSPENAENGVNGAIDDNLGELACRLGPVTHLEWRGDEVWDGYWGYERNPFVYCPYIRAPLASALQSLVLDRAQVGYTQLEESITAAGATLTKLHLSNMKLYDGYWVDILHVIHQHCPVLTDVELAEQGPLQEVSVVNTGWYREYQQTGMWYSTNRTGLRDTVRRWLLRIPGAPAVLPLLSIGQGGGPTDWVGRSDASFRYAMDLWED